MVKYISLILFFPFLLSSQNYKEPKTLEYSIVNSDQLEGNGFVKQKFKSSSAFWLKGDSLYFELEEKDSSLLVFVPGIKLQSFVERDKKTYDYKLEIDTISDSLIIMDLIYETGEIFDSAKSTVKRQLLVELNSRTLALEEDLRILQYDKTIAKDSPDYYYKTMYRKVKRDIDTLFVSLAISVLEGKFSGKEYLNSKFVGLPPGVYLLRPEGLFFIRNMDSDF